jgi:hypothetical protein
MLKQTVVAALTIAVIATSAVPVTTGAALAQARPCTAGAQCPPSEGGSSTYSCTSPISHLRRVYEDELEVIDNPQYVSIMPICETETYGVFRSTGNAGALRSVIADNEAMMEALFRKEFTAEDVVGVRMTGEDKVILFVHPFHRR